MTQATAHPTVAPLNLAELRAAVTRLEGLRTEASGQGHVPTGVGAIDSCLPGGGLARGALHEVSGGGQDTEYGATPALFVAGMVAGLPGQVLWIVQHRPPFAAGLAGAGLHPHRILFVEAGKHVLDTMEEGLRAGQLAAVIGEVEGPMTLRTSRRLHLAAEQGGGLALALRTSRRLDDPALTAPSAAVTRWRVTQAPSPPAVSEAPEVQGVGRARWTLDLWRARGAPSRTWTVAAVDKDGRMEEDLVTWPASQNTQKAVAAA